MQDKTDYFSSNIAVLRARNAALADQIQSVHVPDYYTVTPARNGHPVLRALNVSFHSMYDPIKEGHAFVKEHMKRGIPRNGDPVTVFGFGLGYHLEAMLEHGLHARVIEPRIEVLRLALENRNLRSVLERINIVAGAAAFETSCQLESIWVHQPSAKYSKGAFSRITQRPCQNPTNRKQTDENRLSRSLKIIVVSPIYGGSLPIARYCQRALNNIGHEAMLFDASIFEQPFSQALALKIDARNKKLIHDLFLHLISEMIVASCAERKPDLVLALAQAPMSNKALERLRQHNVTTAFWFVEDYQIMGYWRSHAHLYDFYFTIQDDGFFSELGRTGVKHFYYLPLAADPAIHRPLDMTASDKAYFGSDMSFMGAGYYNRERMLQGLLDYDLKVWGSDWNPMSALWPHVQRDGQRLTTEETVKVFNASKISVNLHSSVCHEGVNPFGDFVNPRTFEIAACGGFQLVDLRSMLSRHFQIGDEVVCYRSLEELREKTSYYLMHPEERRRIALRGRQRVMRDHTYEHRMRELISIIGSCRPEIFNTANKAIPSVIDPGTFCIEHPEVKGLIDDVSGHGLSPDLDHIVSTILKKNGPLAYHEALFLLMKEFQQKFQGTGS